MANNPIDNEDFLNGSPSNSPCIRSTRSKKRSTSKKGDTKTVDSEENSGFSTTLLKVVENRSEISQSAELEDSLVLKVQDNKTSGHGDRPSPIVNGTAAAEENDNEKRTVLPINVKEKIVLCIDTFDDPEGSPFIFSNGKMYKTLAMIQRICTLFLKNKNNINCNHEFAIIELDGKNAHWRKDFTTEIDEVIMSLENIAPNEIESPAFDLSTLFDVISEKVTAPKVSDSSKNPLPPFVIRVIVVYSRSKSIPEFMTGNDAFKLWSASSPNCFLDTLYIHENAADENCKKIYENLRGLETESSFSFRVTRSASNLHSCMAKLLAHPLQRLDSKRTSFKLEGNVSGRNGVH